MTNSIIIFFLLAAFYTTIDTKASAAHLRDQHDRDYTNCNSSFRDVTLYQTVVEKPAKLLQVVSVDEEISTGNAIVHCIQAVELKPEDAGATVSITKGGLGYNFVTLHIQSLRGHGIHFNITVSGK